MRTSDVNFTTGSLNLKEEKFVSKPCTNLSIAKLSGLVLYRLFFIFPLALGFGIPFEVGEAEFLSAN